MTPLLFGDALRPPPPPWPEGAAPPSLLHWLLERTLISTLVFCGAWLVRACWRGLRASQRRALGDPSSYRRSHASAWRASRAECQALLLPVGGGVASS